MSATQRLKSGCAIGRSGSCFTLIPVTSDLVLLWPPGVIQSVLGLVGQASVYLTECDSKFDLQLLLQYYKLYKCVCRSVPEIHMLVAGRLSS